MLPVVFPDSTEAEILYDPSLGLAQLGVTSDTVGLLPGACGADPLIQPYDLKGEAYVGTEPLATFPSPSGVAAELWKGAPGFGELYLVFRFGGWMVLVPCRGPLEEAKLAGAQWANLLQGRESEGGFLVLDALPPLHLSEVGDAPYGPELRFGTSGRLVRLQAGRGCRSSEVVRQAGWARWCLGTNTASVIVTVQSDDEKFIEALEATLQARDIRLGS